MSASPFDPTHRPGLAYQHAFDWLAVHLATVGRAACLAASTFTAAEMLPRLPELPFLTPLPPGLETAAAALGCPQVVPAGPVSGDLEAVAWLEPGAGDVAQLSRIVQSLSPSGWLYLIVGGPLARFLAERRVHADGRGHYLSARAAVMALRRHGFRLVEQVGWHGLQAIGWHVFSQATLRLGQRHRRDRYHFAMRRAFVEKGPGNRLVALSGLAAERVR